MGSPTETLTNKPVEELTDKELLEVWEAILNQTVSHMHADLQQRRLLIESITGINNFNRLIGQLPFKGVKIKLVQV